jgi:hypothetical protein
MALETYSITFGDCAENHAGMQKIGKTFEDGCGLGEKELSHIVDILKDKCKIEAINLKDHLPDKGEDAYVLILRNGIDVLLGKNGATRLLGEIKSHNEDKKALMRGRVVNKRARWNNCYSDITQSPDIEKGKGTIINFKDTKEMAMLREKISNLTNIPTHSIVAEMNHYYDNKKCGIGFHGDTERRIVICSRLGADMPMDFQWFHRFKPVGSRCSFTLHHGDMYIMSEKAVGSDWKRSSIYTLRHAAGAIKYRTI